jgi:hypothetical protein
VNQLLQLVPVLVLVLVLVASLLSLSPWLEKVKLAQVMAAAAVLRAVE